MSIKKSSFFFIIPIFAIVIFIISAHYSFRSIQSKKSDQLLRIGYVNLHERKISNEELRKFDKYDCDIWLFAEWNGNNLDLHPQFKRNYIETFELIDSTTYGFYALTKKHLHMFGNLFDQKSRPYKCDYSKVMISNKYLNIIFIHAPPPVPSCNYQTNKYLDDVLNFLNQNKLTKNQILIGDFNMTSCQTMYDKIIENGFTDSFANKYFLNCTYGIFPGFPKIFRIDYTFFRGNIKNTYSKRFKLNSSDHCGLITDFLID